MKEFRAVKVSAKCDSKASAFLSVVDKVAEEVGFISDLFCGDAQIISVHYEYVADYEYVAAIVYEIERHPQPVRYKLTALGEARLARSTKK